MLFLHFCVLNLSVRGYKSALRRKSLHKDKCQLPFRDTCSKGAFVLDGPWVPSGSGLCCRTAWCHTWAHRQCENMVYFQYILLGTELLISGFKKKKSDGLHKGNVNLMVHESSAREQTLTVQHNWTWNFLLWNRLCMQVCRERPSRRWSWHNTDTCRTIWTVPSPAAFSGQIQVNPDKEFLTLLKSAALLLENCSYQFFFLCPVNCVTSSNSSFPMSGLYLLELKQRKKLGFCCCSSIPRPPP